MNGINSIEGGEAVQDLSAEACVRAWEVQVEGAVFAVVSTPIDMLDPQAPLTPAERDIVRRILRGESNRSIAMSRGTAERTVANQVASIYQKLGLASRSELAAHVSGLRLR